jgi:hypothetical protein
MLLEKHASALNFNAFFACFVRPVFANISLSFTAGSGSGLPLTVPRGRQQLRLLGEIKGLHPEVSDQHKWLAIRKLAVAYVF